MTKIAFYTLGCKSNQYETDKMIEQVRSLGYDVIPYPQAADIYVINTCTVTSNAAKKSRNAVRHSKKLNPNAKVIFTGCDAEMENIPEADVILPNKDKFDLSKHLASFCLPTSNASSSSSSSRIRANLMIEDGCQNYCSYCIVPRVRGKVRSRPMEEIICEAEKMVASGVKEIVLTGINLGEFPVLPSLISHLSSLDGLLCIRLSSIEPQYVTDELIDIIRSNPKVCRHLHIPMQSGDDKILKSMNRRYTSKQYLQMVKNIKEKIQDIAITTDIIVGFPGEDEKAFKNTCGAVDKIKFSRIHIFSYSDRPGTAAFNLENKIDPKITAIRYKKMGQMRDKYMLQFHRSFIKKPMEVLVEQKDRKTGMYEGLTTNYIRVFLQGDDMGDDSISRLVPARFKVFRKDIVLAKPLGRLTLSGR